MSGHYLNVKGFLKYVARRTLLMFIIVVIATYLTILVANMGGHVDTIIRGELQLQISMEYRNNPNYEGFSSEELRPLIEHRFEQEIKRRGLDTPFIHCARKRIFI